MSRLAQDVIFKIPAPTMGVDWSVPLEEVQLPYTPYSYNWIADGYRVKMRDPHTAMSNTTNFFHLASYEREDTIIASIVSGGSAGLYEYFPATGTRNSIGSALVFGDHVNYQGRVFLATTAGATSWDGTTLSSPAFSGASGGTEAPGCCIYRDRYVQVQGSTLFFAPTAGAVSGVLSSFNLASYYSLGEFTRCSAITITDSSNLSDYLIITSSGGDILAFTGDFPGSANWQLVVKTKIDLNPFTTPSAAAYGGTSLGICRYAGDVFLFSKNPARLFSAKALIQNGILEAEKASPIDKVANLLRAKGAYLRNVVYNSGKNALLIETVNLYSWFSRSNFVNANLPTNSIWLYVDLLSGAISPITYPENGGSANANPYYNKSICHSDGFVYSISDGNDVLYRLLDDTVVAQDVNTGTCLQFPYTNLETADTSKNLAMAFPIMSTNNRSSYPTKIVDLAIQTDYDRDQEGYFTITDANNFNDSQKLVLPISGQGDVILLGLINRLYSYMSCQSISIQHQPGGPY